jgi:2-methylcitrate dehydratase PrpD
MSGGINVDRRSLLKLLGAPAAAAVFGTSAWRLATAAPVATREDALAARTGPPTISEAVAAFLARARFEDLPASVIEKTKELLVFSFGRAFEGALGTSARQLDAVAPFLSRPALGSASVIGRRYRLSPVDAAFANCSLMRGDFGRDDVLWPSTIHAGPVTLPAALALGEAQHCSGREFILASVLGYEVMGKLARAAHSWETALPRRPTNVYGAFGPVTAAAHLLKLREPELAHAIAYAANVQIGVAEGSMMTHYYSYVASNGVLAAQLAGAGGAPYVRTTIEGEYGFYRSFFGSVPQTLPALVKALGTDWEIMNSEPKRFHGTGGNAVPLFMVEDILREEPIKADEIERIDVVLPFAHYAQARRDIVASQGPFRKAVDSGGSLPYALTLLLLFGSDPDPKWVAIDAARSVVNDPMLRPYMQRVFVTFEEGHASTRYCRLEIVTTTGRRIKKQTQHFQAPFPRDTWGAWLSRSGSQILSKDQLQTLEHRIVNLENVRDVSTLMAAAVPR